MTTFCKYDRWQYSKIIFESSIPHSPNIVLRDAIFSLFAIFVMIGEAIPPKLSCTLIFIPSFVFNILAFFYLEISNTLIQK